MNGKDILNEIDFDKEIAGMDDRRLMEFTARQIYVQCTKFTKLPCQQQDADCPAPTNYKKIGIFTAIGMVLAGIGIALGKWFSGK